MTSRHRGAGGCWRSTPTPCMCCCKSTLAAIPAHRLSGTTYRAHSQNRARTVSFQCRLIPLSPTGLCHPQVLCRYVSLQSAVISSSKGISLDCAPGRFLQCEEKLSGRYALPVLSAPPLKIFEHTMSIIYVIYFLFNKLCLKGEESQRNSAS